MKLAALSAAAVASLGLAAPALAGPYVMIENTSGFVGGEYDVNVTEAWVGYQDDLSEDVTFFVQAGPTIVARESGDTTTHAAAKAGLNWAATEQLDIFTEVYYRTEANDYESAASAKVGMKYSF